ncbi:MAG: WHG domain-containing protein [Pseudoxanthomonas sp.]
MPRASLNEDELDAMRQRIAEAALDIYRRNGLAAVSFRQLADNLGCSHMQPYRCFANKEALLVHLRIEGFSRMEEFMRSHAGPAESPHAWLRGLVEGYIGFARQHGDEYLLLFSTEQPSPAEFPELLAARRRVFDMAVDAIQQCVDAGDMAGEPCLLAHRVWIGLHGLMTLHAANQLIHGFDISDLIGPVMSGMFGHGRDAMNVAVTLSKDGATRLPARQGAGMSPRAETRVRVKHGGRAM